MDGLLAKAQMGHAGGDRSGADDQILVAGESQLVYQRPHARGVDAAAGRNQTGTDFDDEAHVETSNLTIKTDLGECGRERPLGCGADTRPPLTSS